MSDLTAGSSQAPADRRRPDATTADAFRGDIEGLRGVAVALVVLFHAGVAGFSGGFVGVDVFFVLSGFLITGLLLDEIDRRQRIDLVGFYARRARRLLPASLLVFVATVVLAARAMPALDALDLAPQARWVALFGSNIWFARHATDYLQPDVVSPFQQYWSLALEEQFYLVWPFLLLLLGFRARSRRNRLLRTGAGVALVVVASFVGAVHLTAVRQPSAFFLLPPRAWELGAGALLALALRLGLRVGRRSALLLGVVGALAVTLPAVSYGAGTRFPGWSALPPVTGTVLILLAGSTSLSGGTAVPLAPVNRLLTFAPLRLAGRYSYSLYLWHWPLLVIPAAAAGRPLRPGETVLAVGLSILLAVASFHLLEDRLRHLGPLVRRPLLSYGVGAGLVVVALLSLGTLPTPDRIANRASETAATHGEDLPVALARAVVAAPGDQARVYRNECHRPVEFDESEEPVDVSACTTGTIWPVTPTVMLLGDSHAAHWEPALSEIASRRGWKLTSLTRSYCPLVDVPVKLRATGNHYRECDDWRARVLGLIASRRPDVVVLGQRSSYYVHQVGLRRWLAALQRTVGELSPTTRVVVLRDLPTAPRPVPKCILANTDDLDSCEFEVSVNDQRRLYVERAVVAGAGGIYVDPVAIVCPSDRCDVIDDDQVVFSDSNHLTASYSRSIAAELAQVVEPALGI